ncbi:hypothetical protein D3C87_1694730 [compost metagenome]
MGGGARRARRHHHGDATALEQRVAGRLQADGQAMAAEFLRHIHGEPPGLRKLAEGIDEAGRRPYPAVDNRGADPVGGAVERMQHALGKSGGLLDDGRDGGIVAVGPQGLDASPVRRHCKKRQSARGLRLKT